MKHDSNIQILSIFIFVLILIPLKTVCQNVDWTDSSYFWKGHLDKDTLSISLCRSRFNPSKHVLSSTGNIVVYSTSGEHPVIDRIDEHDIWGSEYGYPKYELSQFKVTLNGQPIQIPKTLYNDCYNPDVNGDGITIVVADDKKSVLVEMNSGDGANTYFVWWTISLNGKVTRYISLGE
ncbi:hypothetical protein [Microbacter margulisiae]|uniref:Uncharacterized protein n=1 Tax=Microbacter margulisiae TaxID=1350067 RepID=A0A7W5DPW5_9PORP|nr:hypothetical protein [Microbacter margulisiae]MBB3186796.1 hypothetical protein [Microbacter margulisiae]